MSKDKTLTPVPMTLRVAESDRDAFNELCNKEGISAASKIRMFIKSEIKKGNKS
jgi:hypothetical protein